MNDPCITWVVLVLSWNLSQTLNARLVQYLNFCFLRVLGKQREDSFARYTYSHRHLLSSLHSRRREGIGRKGKGERLSRFSPSPLPLPFFASAMQAIYSVEFISCLWAQKKEQWAFIAIIYPKSQFSPTGRSHFYK